LRINKVQTLAIFIEYQFHSLSLRTLGTVYEKKITGNTNLINHSGLPNCNVKGVGGEKYKGGRPGSCVCRSFPFVFCISTTE
jgi:hypothetical protein